MTHDEGSGLPTFRIPIGFIVAAVLVIGAKELIVGSMMKGPSRGGATGLAEHMATLDSVESVVGASYIIAILLGVIGAVLLIRALAARIR